MIVGQESSEDGGVGGREDARAAHCRANIDAVLHFRLPVLHLLALLLQKYEY